LSQFGIEAWFAFVVFLRVGVAMSLSPGYGERTVSMRIKLVIGLLVAISVVPAVRNYLPQSVPPLKELLFLSLREGLIGIFFGLVSRGVVFLIEIAGTMISQSMSLAQMFGNAADSMPAISHVMTVAALALIFSTPIGDYIFLMFAESYKLTSWSFDELVRIFSELYTAIVNFVFRNAFVLASPFIAIALIYYFFTGMINKTMPQFMVTFIGVPLVALLAIWLLYDNAEQILSSWVKKAYSLLAFVTGRKQ